MPIIPLRRICAPLFAFVMITGASQAATIVIDDFTTPSAPITVSSGGAISNTVAPEALSGERRLQIATSKDATTMEVTGGQLAYTAGPTSISGSVSWMLPMSSPVDLSDGGTNDRIGLFAQADRNFRLNIALVDSDASLIAYELFSGPVATMTEFQVLFSDFVTVMPSFNLSSIVAVGIIISADVPLFGDASLNLKLDDVVVTNAPPVGAVPVPAGLVLILTGLGALGMGRMRVSG